MTTARKPKMPADPLVAAETILIDGKVFPRGAPVFGIDMDELARAVAERRVIRQSLFDFLAARDPALGKAQESEA